MAFGSGVVPGGMPAARGPGADVGGGVAAGTGGALPTRATRPRQRCAEGRGETRTRAAPRREPGGQGPAWLTLVWSRANWYSSATA